jgi:hypothetical protein
MLAAYKIVIIRYEMTIDRGTGEEVLESYFSGILISIVEKLLTSGPIGVISTGGRNRERSLRPHGRSR